MNYSRWVPVHLYDMLTLRKRLPQTYAHLLNGGVTVQKTAKAFSAIAIDQAHKQNNGKVKGDGGAVGLTGNPAALRRWMISEPEVARLIAEFEASPEADKETKPGSLRHHEEAKRTQLSFAEDVKSLTSVIDDMGNPFTEESGDLLVLDTKDLADSSVLKTVEEAEALGREQFETFVKERLSEERTKSVHDPIKKNKLSLFRSPRQKEPSKVKQQISSLKSDCELFSRLFIACQTREGGLDEFFEHENQGCPPSMSQNGKLRLPGKKSDLIECIQSLSQTRTSAPSPIDAAIIDGAAAINMLKPTNTVNKFQEYADQVFIPYIRGQLQHVKRVDIKWDEYVPNSLKATTREKGEVVFAGVFSL